jgi:hypothetical protein
VVHRAVEGSATFVRRFAIFEVVMQHRFSSAVFSATVTLVSALTAGACAVRGAPVDSGPGGGGTDAPGGGGFDAPGFFPDGAVNPCAPGCGPEELCGEGDGNGINDDCDARVDEGCMCAPGTSRECFSGTPDRANVGACSNGVEYCNEFGIYDTCSNEHIPAMETCDGIDNDCDGVTDNGVTGCTTAFTCPGNEIAAPLSTHTLRGDRVFAGGTAYQWGIECPASVPSELCPRLATPNAMNSDVYLTASGAYRVTVRVTLPDGTVQSCAWTLYVRGGDGGLRVELNWDSMLDTAGGHDMDLHLHRWTDNFVETPWFTDDDCYYGNCTPGNTTISWPGHPDSDLMNCSSAPHGGGADWTTRGGCANPRLDVDTNGIDGACNAGETDPNEDAFCAPENINVDSPIIGQPYRVLANFYSDSGAARDTNVYVNIFCGGNLRGSFGSDTSFMPFSSADGTVAGEGNASWLVADVVFVEGACGLDCIVYPILQRVEPRGFVFDLPFGPSWQCEYDGARTCIPR